MNDDHKPNGGDGGGDNSSDNNVVVKIRGKYRNFSFYINMGYLKTTLFCILVLLILISWLLLGC